ncbi:MAG: DUF4430 domain-containing protein [Lachnospiraceae bacterium]
MKFKENKRMKSLLLCMMLIVAMAFTAVGCGTKNDGGDEEKIPKSSVSEETTQAETTDAEATEIEENSESAVADAQVAADQVLGEGQTQFMFTVTDQEGNSTNFEIHTDKATVGEALLELGLIAGDEGEYGLYVKTVNGITADYDVDKTYWAFYINGEYASTGVDATAVEEGAAYTFKIEK